MTEYETTRPLLISDIAELVFLITLEASAVAFFVGVAILGAAILTGGM